MTRRDFLAAVGAAGLLPWRTSAATPFPVRYAKPNPYEGLRRFVQPGNDAFAGEKEAVELEARLGRIFAGTEPAPEGLAGWAARRAEIRAARFYALPEGRVRFEIAAGHEYHTGIWKPPDF